MTNCGFADANDDRDWNALDDVLKSSQSESSESEGGEKTGNPMNYWVNQPKSKRITLDTAVAHKLRWLFLHRLHRESGDFAGARIGAMETAHFAF